jgi:hypothetical protein
MKTCIAVIVVAAGTIVSGRVGMTGRAQTPPGDCVVIGTPKPSVTYVYEHSETNGKRTQVTNVWESVTDTGIRLRTDGPNGVTVQANEHRIVDDVSVIEKSTKMDARGGVIDTTLFRPGMVGDPAFRACAGRSWTIPAATATYQSRQANASATSPAGTLKILSIRERITVPAGTFDAVRYVRTSQSTDEYWKSIEHGVIVKHTGTLPVGTVTDVLVSIR